MSLENAHAFLKEAQGNAALRNRIAALKGAGSLKKLAMIAAESGFYFTEDEYRLAVMEAAEGELSDSAINAVIDEIKMGRRG